MVKSLLIIVLISSGTYSFALDKVLTIPVKEVPQEINSFYGNDLTLNKIINQIAEGLVKLDDSLYPQPALAAKWKVDSKEKSVEFSLRKGAKFHDGSLVESKDIFRVFSESIKMKSDLTSQILDFDKCQSIKICKSFIVISSNEFKVILSDLNFIGFLRKISNIEGVMFKKKGKRFLGTGPFKIKSVDKEKIVLVKVGSSYFEKIVFEKMTDDQALKSFLSKKIDFISDSDFKVIKADFSNVVKEESTVLTFGIVFNLENGVFKLKQNRKILASAIDREKFVSLYSHPVVIANGLIPKGYKGAVKVLRITKVPRQSFKAGKENEVVLALRHKYKGNIALTEYLPNLLKSLGLNVKVVFDDFGSILKDFKKKNGKYHLTIKGEAPRYYDSASVFLPYVFGQFSNITNYKNDELTKLYFKSEQVAGTEKLKVFKRMEEILREDIPVIPLFHPVFTKWYQSSIDIKKNSKSSIRFWDFPFYSYSRNEINTVTGGQL